MGVAVWQEEVSSTATLALSSPVGDHVHRHDNLHGPDSQPRISPASAPIITSLTSLLPVETERRRPDELENFAVI